VDAPCQSNIDSGGTWREQAVPDRVGNLLSSELWYAQSKHTNRDYPTAGLDNHLSGMHVKWDTYVHTRRNLDRVKNECQVSKTQGQQNSMGRSTLPGSRKALTHHHHIFSTNRYSMYTEQDGYGAYLSDVSPLHVGTVIILSYVTNSASDIHVNNTT